MTLPLSLSRDERIDWLRLIRSENVGPITFFALLGHFGTVGEALAGVPGMARRGGNRKAIRICPRADAERECAAVEAAGATLLACGEAGYPPQLAHIADPPPLISVMGNAHLLSRPAVAVVGARNASANGVRFARGLGAQLTEAGFVVVSGLARGIDAAAHQGALSGGTVAVLAGGVDVVYPPENEQLYADIVSSGVAISEMPPGTAPLARHFPRRNRLVSGVSYGVVIVEAAARSGSLITARLALEQDREVFAVPGSPLDPRCRGPNNLLRSGATICESADDVVRVLNPLVQAPLSEPGDGAYAAGPAAPRGEEELARGQPLILEKLGPSPVEVDELVRQTGLSPATVLTVLLELELAGRLRRQPGNQVHLIIDEIAS